MRIVEAFSRAWGSAPPIPGDGCHQKKTDECMQVASLSSRETCFQRCALCYDKRFCPADSGKEELSPAKLVKMPINTITSSWPTVTTEHCICSRSLARLRATVKSVHWDWLFACLMNVNFLTLTTYCKPSQSARGPVLQAVLALRQGRLWKNEILSDSQYVIDIPLVNYVLQSYESGTTLIMRFCVLKKWCQTISRWPATTSVQDSNANFLAARLALTWSAFCLADKGTTLSLQAVGQAFVVYSVVDLPQITHSPDLCVQSRF